MSNERIVELVAADADRLPHHDAAQRENRDFGCTAADVHDHRSLRLPDG